MYGPTETESQLQLPSSLLLGDHAKVLSLILSSQCKKQKQHLNHHLKQRYFHENDDKWEMRYGQSEFIGTLHANNVELSYFLFYPHALVQRAKPHVKEDENNKFPMHTEFLHKIEVLIAFKQLITNYVSHHVIFSRMKTVWKRSWKTTWCWGLTLSIHKFLAFVTKDECLSEKPRNCLIWAYWFHFRIFWPFWSMKSSMKVEHCQTWVLRGLRWSNQVFVSNLEWVLLLSMASYHTTKLHAWCKWPWYQVINTILRPVKWIM